MFENIREAFDGIWSHKLRSALTMLHFFFLLIFYLSKHKMSHLTLYFLF